MQHETATPRSARSSFEAYAKIAEGRRDNNKLRTDALERATKACGVTLTLLTVELVLAFVAVAVHAGVV